jgi:pantetheine-phosphate adenylyltransferase
MHQPRNNIAVFPGMFDPVTNGHMDIITRGARLFNRLIVAVGRNPAKTEVFSAQQRVDMMCELVSEFSNVEVESYDGLTMEFARKIGAQVLLRGIRDNVDLRDELLQANTNLIVGDVETVFLMTSDQHALISSTLIKQIVEIGGYDPKRLERLVPKMVADRLRARYKGGGNSTGG